MKNNITVMIIDNDADDRELFHDTLKEINSEFKFLSESNGQDALHYLHTAVKPPDFIFLDLNMPKMSGRHCIVQMKKIPLLRHTPIIVYSTSQNPGDKIDLKLLGASRFLTKPTKMAVLKKELQNIIYRHKKKAVGN